MTPELWQRLKPLLHAALDRGTGERVAFISEVCGDDAELKENLARLIQSGQEETKAPGGFAARTFQSQESRFRPGDLILGRFRILRPIGSGGMGDVYEAEDLQLGRVALKTIRDGIASSGAFERFRQEVQLARNVSGSQVCRIHELYLLPANEGYTATAFLTMEYLEGITLSEKLKRDGPLPFKDALPVALDICEGLRLVHEKGVIHRDLKSANIMLCGHAGSFRAVLMDFGLARKFTSDVASDPTVAHEGRLVGTLTGTIVGTPAYMAPEQFEAKPVSPATDIYALGIVLYELVTGFHPYAASTPVATAVRRAQYPAPPSSLNRAIPRKWDRIIQRCLQFEASDRFQSADEVAKELRAGPANLRNLRLDRPWFFRIACALIMAAFAWGVYNWWQTRQYYHPRPEALETYTNGLSLIRQGHYAEATRVLQAALDQDQHFVMAHARMAEALYNLDFKGSAQQELLIALPGRSRLSSLNRMYLDAIHATVMGDSSGAVEDYKRILGDLPSPDKSSGYVDLGMAYERAGDIPHALDMYSKAASLNPNNPASYMHTGILQSRLHHVKEGEQSFARAQAIFESEVDSFGRAGNPEGLAELDYERGYAANDRGDSKHAEPILERSWDEAAKIPSIQLEIRALAQLSSAEAASDSGSQAVEHAEEAIRLARDNQLESWAAMGLVRLASVQLGQGHLNEAEKPLQEAMQILHQSPQPRVEAFANVTKASLMDQENRPNEVAGPAQAALDYYKKNGYFAPATGAALLLVRAEANQGRYKQALESGNGLLTMAAQSEIPALRMQAEELMGTVNLELEQYPDALTHFRNAKDSADTDTRRSYQALHCALVLWKLGRYAESEEMFKVAAGNASLQTSVAEGRADSLLSQQRFKAALQLAQRTIAADGSMEADSKRSFQQDEVIAESHLGMKKQALAGLSAYVAPDQKKDDPSDTAHDKLTAAEIYFWMGMNQQARDAALAAQDYFASSGQVDSELQSACYAAAASKALKDEAGYESSSKKVLDILSKVRKNWAPAAVQQYIARPDIRALTQQIQKGEK
jgi:tetratricopeptide (TPR) repeat protein